jgi:hypothetical protein
VKSPETPKPVIEDPSTPAPPSVAKVLGADVIEPAPATHRRSSRRERFEPQFVELPAAAERRRGPLNLAMGAATLLLAAVLLAAAIVLGGPAALAGVGVSLVTFAALYVLARMHVFRQRHGVFLALGVVVLLGAAFSLCERALIALDRLTKIPAAVAEQKPEPPPAAPAPEPLPPLITESFALTPPEPKSGGRVKALRDSRVVIEGKPFLIKAGDVFPLAEAKGSEVTFKVRDIRIALPAHVVEVLDEPPAAVKTIAEEKPKPEPAAAAPSKAAAMPAGIARVTALAQEEASRRYPALSVQGSQENKIYISTYQELKHGGGEEFFNNPEWPLELAELIAKREGWRRQDIAPAPNAPPAPDAGPGPATTDPLNVPPADAGAMPADGPPPPVPE